MGVGMTQVLIDHATLQEALPCPFCGSTHVGHTKLDYREFVICNRCGAGADSVDTAPEKTALEVWNTRTAPQAQQRELRTCENCAVNDKSEHPKCMMCCGPNAPNTRYQPINTDKMDLHKQAYRKENL